MKSPLKSFLLLVCTTVSLPGCLFHFAPLPTTEEYVNDVEGTLESYPQLARLQPRIGKYMGGTGLMNGDGFSMPPGSELVEAWGEPDRWRISWWNLNPLVLLFRPASVWYYEVGDKQIYVNISHFLWHGYNQRVWMIGIEDNSSAASVEEVAN